MVDEIFLKDSSNKSEENSVSTRKIQIVHPIKDNENKNGELVEPQKRPERARIVFGDDNENTQKKSVHERLGKRPLEKTESSPKKTRINLAEVRKEEERILGMKKSGNDQTNWRNKKESVSTDTFRNKSSDKHREVSKLHLKVFVPLYLYAVIWRNKVATYLFNHLC